TVGILRRHRPAPGPLPPQILEQGSFFASAPMRKRHLTPPATLAAAMASTTLADAMAGKAIGWGETLTGHVMGRCEGCGVKAQLLAADLVAEGVLATTQISHIGRRLRCAVCGSQAVSTWPKLRVSKRVDAKNWRAHAAGSQ